MAQDAKAQTKAMRGERVETQTFESTIDVVELARKAKK
jgi:hypothetical protein